MGSLDKIEEAPFSDAETTVFVIKTFNFNTAEVWCRHPTNQEWLRHGNGHAMEHMPYL